MTVNQFNIGKDVSLSLVGPSGPLQSFGLLVEFEARPRSTVLESLPINNHGIPVNRATYQGWDGHFLFDRQNGMADRVHNILESNFFADNPDVHFQITESVRNADGTTDRYSYLDCVLTMESSGTFRQNDKVQPRFNFRAAQRVEG